MMPPQLMDKIRASISGNASDTITLLKNFKNYMHPVEKQIYTILESSNKKHPNLDFHEILRKNINEQKDNWYYSRPQYLVI